MKKGTPSLVFCSLACAFFLPSFALADSETEPDQTIPLPILTYHYVESLEDATRRAAALITSPVVFEKQLLALQERGYQTVFVRDIPSRLVSPLRSFPAIALTFDDGYEDFYWNVLPLLRKYRMKTTLYVVPGFIGKTGYLSEEELRAINDTGLVEIGAHTLHHKNLPRLSTAAATQEIRGGKEELEQKFGITVSSFAYPFGAHTPRIEKIVEGAGFTAAVTTDRGWDQSPSRLYTLRRIPGLVFLGSRKWKAIGEPAAPSVTSSASSTASPSARPNHRRSTR
ncbi:MAG: polysaccharide deacetylase family protein [Candidatus Peribacteraceae bacterium]|nr:polysaccharide deacetylase family protein [Candidatus Peribacteraceae bacterium]MDD5742383.1 polysaccharide deacetylase family protein [Candidatus Peribacteraceae bacterium]